MCNHEQNYIYKMTTTMMTTATMTQNVSAFVIIPTMSWRDSWCHTTNKLDQYAYASNPISHPSCEDQKTPLQIRRRRPRSQAPMYTWLLFLPIAASIADSARLDRSYMIVPDRL